MVLLDKAQLLLAGSPIFCNPYYLNCGGAHRIRIYTVYIKYQCNTMDQRIRSSRYAQEKRVSHSNDGNNTLLDAVIHGTKDYGGRLMCRWGYAAH